MAGLSQPNFTCLAATKLSLRQTPLEGGQLELVQMVSALERVHCTCFFITFEHFSIIGMNDKAGSRKKKKRVAEGSISRSFLTANSHALSSTSYAVVARLNLLKLL